MIRRLRPPVLLVAAGTALGLLLAVLPGPAAAVSSNPVCGPMQHVLDANGQSVPPVDSRQPVLFIHGFNGGPLITWNGSSGIAAQLEAPGSGYFVGRFDYSYQGMLNQQWVTDPRISGTSAHPGQLAEVIDCMAQESRTAGGPGKVILISYSLGGLAAQQAISETVNGRKVAEDVGGLVSIGTPWQGINPNLDLTEKLISDYCNAISPAVTGAATGDACLLLTKAGSGSPAAQAMVSGSNGGLSAEMQNLPKIPVGIPALAVAGNMDLKGGLFRWQFEVGGSDGVVDTGSATSPPMAANPSSRQLTTATIPCRLDRFQPPTTHSKVGSSPWAFLPDCFHVNLPTDPAVAQQVNLVLEQWKTKPDFYIHNGYELGALFKYPNFPTTIGLDNHDSLSELQWRQVSATSATATGALNIDNCTPSCASGTTIQYTIQLTASNPQHCTVAVYKQYSSVPQEKKVYVFNKIQLKALSGNPPSYLIGSTPALPPACSPLPPSAPTPTAPSTSPNINATQPSSPKSTTKTVTIPANGGWIDTGLSLSLTDSVDIKASGSWTPDGTDYTSPSGFGRSMLSADNYINLSDLGACATCATSMYPEWAALMSYTGSDPPQPGSYTSTTVAPQANLVDYVGSSLTTTKFWPYTGELWLGINDDAYSGYTSDNQGQVTATITVTHP